MVNSNGFTCPLLGFCGRQVPDRFGGACAARPITTTTAISPTVNIARFISSSFGVAMLHRILSWDNRGPPSHLQRLTGAPARQALREKTRASAANEPRERSEPSKRLARERVGEFRLRQGYGGHRRSFSEGVPRGEAPRSE